MELDDIQNIGCETGLLTRYCKQNPHDIHYSFMHKTVAEFAVAKLLYNTKMWKYAYTLNYGKWSTIHYYLLMHSICTNNTGNNDDGLWHMQVQFAFNFSHDEGTG